MFRTRSAADDAALCATLAHASRAPHYARTWGARWKRIRGAADLHELPALTKPVAAEVQEDLRVPGVPMPPDALAAGVVSSATTRTGRPLRVLHAPSELDAEDDLSPHPPREPTQRTLVLHSPRHGVRLPEGPGRVLLPVTPHPNTVDVLWDLLTARGGVPFTAIVAPVSALKWITVALQERGLDPSTTRVENIGTNGYPLTDHARAWLGAAWGARTWDNYSLSEIRGYAWECAACGHLHWDGARVLAELVDPHGHAPVRGNPGELLLTTLLPDTRLMPLVRYATGDLVFRGPRCPVEKTRGIRFAGRVGQGLSAVVKGRTVHAVLGRDLLEWAEATPDVAQHASPAERLGLVPQSDIGVPRAVVDAARQEVHVELRYDPVRHAARAAAVAASLAQRVFRPGAPRPSIRLFRPGTLDIGRLALKL